MIDSHKKGENEIFLSTKYMWWIPESIVLYYDFHTGGMDIFSVYIEQIVLNYLLLGQWSGKMDSKLHYENNYEDYKALV